MGSGRQAVRQRAVERVVLVADERSEVPPPDDLVGAGQARRRLREQVLAPLDERAAVVVEDEPGAHALVPDDVAHRAQPLVQRVRVEVAEICAAARRAASGRASVTR